VVPATVNNVQSAAAVRVGTRHLARPITAVVRDVITGSDVTTIAVDVAVDGREMDVLFRVTGLVGVGETHRLTTASRAAATQDGATGSGR